VRDVFVVPAPISGELSRIDLHAGDTVVAHSTVLASIKPVSPSLLDKRARLVAEASIDATKAAVDLASAQLRQATAQAAFMKAEQRRAEILSHQGAISQMVHDKAVLDASVAAADEDRAKANLAVQQQYESARAVIFPVSTGSNQGPCCVDAFAPTSGQVLRIVTESEQVVQMGTPLVEVGDTNDIEVAVDLLSRDAVRVVPGNKAVIDGWGGPALFATVVRVDPVAVTKVSALGIEEQRVSTVLKLDGANQPGQRLGHGFRVVAHIVVWEEDNILSIPVSALFRVGTD
jgi:HlyD family secretion protein